MVSGILKLIIKKATKYEKANFNKFNSSYLYIFRM